MAARGGKYPRLSLVARLTPGEKLRVVLDERRGMVIARFFRMLQAHLASSVLA